MQSLALINTLKRYGSMFSSESLVDKFAELEFWVHSATSAVKLAPNVGLQASRIP